MRNVLRLLLVTTFVAGLVGCGGPARGALADATITLSFYDITVGGMLGSATYVVQGDTLTRDAGGSASGDASGVSEITLTASQRDQVDAAVADALAQGNVGGDCTDSPGAFLTVTWPDGRTGRAAASYCGATPPPGSKVVDLMNLLAGLQPR